jgi:hypothetical protein
MLERGSRGASVRRLQERLQALGYAVGAADGVFGARTDQAVRAFQKAHGPVVDEVVGPVTEAALAGEGGAPPTPPSSLTLPVPKGVAAIRSTFGDTSLISGPAPNTPCYLRVAGNWASQSLGYAHPQGIPAISRIYCPRKLAPVVEAVFAEIAAAGLADEIQSFDGCYCPRYKRRTSRQSPSVHCWGIALDINAATNALGTKGDMSPTVVAIFRKHGSKWGGDWTGKSRDPMHFQYCTGY